MNKISTSPQIFSNAELTNSQFAVSPMIEENFIMKLNASFEEIYNTAQNLEINKKRKIEPVEVKIQNLAVKNSSFSWEPETLERHLEKKLGPKDDQLEMQLQANEKWNNLVKLFPDKSPKQILNMYQSTLGAHKKPSALDQMIIDLARQAVEKSMHASKLSLSKPQTLRSRRVKVSTVKDSKLIPHKSDSTDKNKIVDMGSSKPNFEDLSYFTLSPFIDFQNHDVPQEDVRIQNDIFNIAQNDSFYQELENLGIFYI